KRSMWADAALLTIAKSKDGAAAKAAIEAGWAEPKRRAQVLRAIGSAKIGAYKDKVVAALNDADKGVSHEARSAAGALRIDVNKKGETAPLIATMKTPDVIAAIMKTKGDAKLG